ncbi:hypothetical protein [Acinetobacter shaoyimingii]|uniref:DUF4209 domain-containing protein n=1 Tax=Acinetobacter shaoyimingii TaxID=2715164 RepID=A0A6G8RZU8_9GAMM|nr:hypothetical protein [Acinetobacter shaoyimingii]QIO07370.1 hypothetical protein G8E00_16205 [Acinetobacter shaoyimingii]
MKSFQKKEPNNQSEFYKGIQKIALGVYVIGHKLSQVILPIATEIQDLLKNIDPEKFTHFIERIEKLQKFEPYLTKLFHDLKNNENFSHAHETISLACLIQLIYENEQHPDDVHIFDVIKTAYFKDLFFSQFSNIQLGENFSQREAVLKEAFQLYELGFYAGCLTLLYAQLEGILTDYLFEKKMLIKSKNEDIYMGPYIQHTKITPYKVIKGMKEKLLIAKHMDPYFVKLDAYKIDSTYPMNNDRNAILHGAILDRFTQERCFILFIWVNSIFNFLQSERSVDS